MKTASAPLRALIESGQFFRCDLYTLTLVDGTILRWTSADIDVPWGSHTFFSTRVQREFIRVSLGLSVDQMKVTVFPQPTDLVGGLPLGAAVRGGVLDGAQVLIEKAYLSSWGSSGVPLSAVVVGVLHGFQGRVSDVDGARGEFQLSASSMLELMNIDMPRNVYQSTCIHTVYDQGCTLSRAAFTVTGAVTSAPTQNSIVSGLSQAAGYFDQGVIAFTSGALSGSRRTVRTYSGGAFSWVLPLPVAPAIGDTFSVYPGCDRTQATCLAKFNNLAHFKGYPYIPTPETAY